MQGIWQHLSSWMGLQVPFLTLITRWHLLLRLLRSSAATAHDCHVLVRVPMYSWASGISAGVNEGGYERNSALFVFEVTITLTEAGLRAAPGALLPVLALHTPSGMGACTILLPMRLIRQCAAPSPGTSLLLGVELQPGSLSLDQGSSAASF